jgi:hypothetical protein
MSTYLLVHGAMHGAWCWRDVEPLLREAGHATIAATLTGQGERADELTPEIGVDTHVADVVAAAGAFLVEPGECLLDVEPPATSERYVRIAQASGDGWRIPASPAFLDQWGITDPALRDFVGPRLTDFPLKCATDPVHYDPGYLTGLPRTYVEHTAPPLTSLAKSIERAGSGGWRLVPLATGHDLMLTAPREAAEVLLAAAE